MSSSAFRIHINRAKSVPLCRTPSLKQTHVAPHQQADLDLTITGMSTPALNREMTWISHRPSENLKKSDDEKHTVLQSMGWRTDKELVDQVKEKLTREYEGVKQLFKDMDPYGDSIVTREGLFITLKTLVGHISRDQFESFLKAINLHWRTSVSFEEFLMRFNDNSTVTSYKASDKHCKQKSFKILEESIHNKEPIEWCPFTSASHAFIVLCKKLHKGEIRVTDIFPASCFLNDGRIMIPQLREALAIVGLKLTDKEFIHLWNKFDSDNKGSVTIQKFYKILNSTQGCSSNSEPGLVNSAQSIKVIHEERQSLIKKADMKRSIATVDSVEILGNRAELFHKPNEWPLPKSDNYQTCLTEVTTTTKQIETTTTKTTQTITKWTEGQLIDESKLSSYIKTMVNAKKSTPVINDVIDKLHYKFEETYRNLMSAFKIFDLMNDGYVARVDFRRILNEFGFNIDAIDLDSFLALSEISYTQGFINYKQFLKKFQERKESIFISEDIHKSPGSNYKCLETRDVVKLEKTVKELKSYFHSDYLNLLGIMKKKDKNGDGTVSAHDLRSAVNTVLDICMTDHQFESLLQKLNDKYISTSKINYATFLDFFNTEPGFWNRCKKGEFVCQKYNLVKTTPCSSVRRLQEKAAQLTISPKLDSSQNLRLSEIRNKLINLFTSRFHVFDKNFQNMDRKRCGYMTKWQFGAIIKLCGIILTVKDLDLLWNSMDTASDCTLSYHTLIKTFSPGYLQSMKDKPKTLKPPEKIKETKKTLISDRQTDQFKVGRLGYLIKKVKDDVMSKWNIIYAIFLNLDRDGHSSIGLQNMKDLIEKMKFPLTVAERDELCSAFDVHLNGWFHYIQFLKAVTEHSQKPPDSHCVFNIRTKHLHRKAGPTSLAITIYDFIYELKEILLKKFKTLRGAFKFFDLNHNGFIEETEMKKSLTLLGYNLSNQDFTDIFEVFDQSQRKGLSFENFKNTLLNVL
ncbi:EF-hand calcium-binding domain-containing protein 6-like isoform X2 [Physella acuta]|uniref:EF-hand calcium-binding domain-containing protein 6-like isoform X2 n=1 Tax=Physella acuta TaxID=109671 RepID=UPI0027DB66C3|nr:EF-hand calcium-binding domain-containing protein 6-like isoform X2 [Physella acuta]